MKTLILVLAMFVTINSKADENQTTNELELVGGGLSYHLLDNADSTKYAHKVSGDGKLIANPLVGLRFSQSYSRSETYDSAVVFTGQNSIGKPIYGAAISHGIYKSWFQLGGIFGGYIQNNNEFDGTGVVPDSFGTSHDSNAFVPLFGVEFNIKIPVSRKVEFKINNIVSPLLTNTTASVGLKF